MAAAASVRFKALYPHHQTRRRKVWQDGEVRVDRGAGKAVLYGVAPRGGRYGDGPREVLDTAYGRHTAQVRPGQRAMHPCIVPCVLPPGRAGSSVRGARSERTVLPRGR